MKRIFISILSLFLFSAGGLQAQTFASRKLVEIGELFPKNCLPQADSIFNCPQITKGKSLIVRYNAKNEIEHLGISLFSPESKEMINLPVCNFIERVMLELVLQKSSGDVLSKLSEYRIRLKKDGVEYGAGSFRSLSGVLNEVQNPTKFTLHKDSLFTAYWEFGMNESLSMSFPASRELIFGTDKMESDTAIDELFANDDSLKCLNTNIPYEPSSDGLIAVQGTDLYKRKGMIFMIDKIKSDTYYQRSDSLYKIVFSPYYPVESLANLFITKQIKNRLRLDITHRKYGSFTPEFTVSLERFVSLFDKGFSTYCVLQRSKAGKVQLSVILHNDDFSYIHLLQITTTAEELFHENGILTADFYTNIPLHNLKSLFQ